MGLRVSPVRVIRPGKSGEQRDIVAAEEPLEIRLEYGPEEQRQELRLAVTMRTPGNDDELAAGFLFAEGIINSPEDLVAVRYCENTKKEERENVIRAILDPACRFSKSQLERNFYTTSSCGVCGKSSLEAVRVSCLPVTSDLKINSDVIAKAPETMRAGQQVFEHTGGLHAAGLFDRDGKLLMLREDVGRHNALDKLIGAGWQTPVFLSEGFLMLSGRTSFELIQKAARAGIPVVAAVGAPSSLAVSLAEETGITLIGFVRQNSFNCYTSPERINFI